jgi:hypothetical protein
VCRNAENGDWGQWGHTTTNLGGQIVAQQAPRPDRPLPRRRCASARQRAVGPGLTLGNKSMPRTTILGFVFTGLWIASAILYGATHSKSFVGLAPNEWGDFLAGLFAPLAFLWLIIGHLQHSKELQAHAGSNCKPAKSITCYP